MDFSIALWINSRGPDAKNSTIPHLCQNLENVRLKK